MFLAVARSLWVQLDAYESDLANLSKEQEVEPKVEPYQGKLSLGA